MIEQIARHLCEADGYDPDIIGLSGNPRWWLYTRTAEHTIPLLAEAWSLGVGVGMFCGPHDLPPNPYRQGSGLLAQPFPTREEIADTIYDALEVGGWYSVLGLYPYEVANAVLDLLKGTKE